MEDKDKGKCLIIDGIVNLETINNALDAMIKEIVYKMVLLTQRKRNIKQRYKRKKRLH